MNELDRFRGRLAGQTKTPTPNQILHILGRKEAGKISPDVFFHMLPPEVVDEFLSRKGNPKPDKIKKFYKSVDEFLDNYTVDDLLKMDINCIKKDGSILQEKLDEILENGTKD